jgi:replicative DNA helicase
MDNIDLDILRFLSDREQWEGYKDYITKGLCTKESWTLVGDIGRYYADNPQVQAITEDFKLWMRITAHPGWKPEEHQVYGQIIDNALTRPQPERAVFVDQLSRHRFVANVGRQYDKLRDNDITAEDFSNEVEHLSTGLTVSSTDSVDIYDIESIADHHRTSTGMYWRCEDVNQSVGPIRTGDFTVIAKRPEVGGTSFLASEMSFMLEQMPDKSNAIIFSNEEEPTKIYTRMMSSALGEDFRTMMGAPAVYKQRYEQWLGDKSWELKHDGQMTLSSIKRKLREKHYGLIGINVLLKVGGTSAKEDHDKFQALGEEMRRIAAEHGPVLAIVQADPSAEGMRYIPQDRIYKSKTALQGEADVLIMIGASDDARADARFIHVAKNKLPPADCCDLMHKHIKSEVQFDIGTGRFTSVNFPKHSRYD